MLNNIYPDIVILLETWNIEEKKLINNICKDYNFQFSNFNSNLTKYQANCHGIALYIKNNIIAKENTPTIQ